MGKTATKKPKAKPPEVRSPAPPGPSAHEAPPGAPPAQVDGIVPLADVRPSPLNPRKTFPQASIDALASSFNKHGITSRLLVRPVGEPGKQPFLERGRWVGLSHFELIDGERRYRAAAQLELAEVPVAVRWADDATALELMLVANDQREDVPPSEQAAGYAALAGMGRTLEQICAATGQPRNFVRSTLALAKLPAWALAAVDAGTLPRATAELVARVPGEESRRRCAVRVLENRSPGMIDDEWCDARIREFDKKGIPDAADLTPLSYRETKDLIRTHFQRQLKGAPFSLKVLYTDPDCEPGHEIAIPTCEACPKRAGNDAEATAEGVRADTCLDPECYAAKVEAYRHLEREKAAAKGVADSELTDVGHPAPKGWAYPTDRPWECDLHADFPIGAKRRDEALAALLGDAECPKYLAFDKAGKATRLLKVSEVRAALRAAGVLPKAEKRKPEPKPAKDHPRPQRGENAPTKGGGGTVGPSEADVDRRTIGLAAKILGEYAEEQFAQLADIEDACADGPVVQALRLSARVLAYELMLRGTPANTAVLRLQFPTLSGESAKQVEDTGLLDDIATWPAARCLAFHLQMSVAIECFDGANSEVSEHLLGFAELNWDELQQQARRELAGGETADAKIERAEAALDDTPEPAPALVPIGEVEGVPDAAPALAPVPPPCIGHKGYGDQRPVESFGPPCCGRAGTYNGFGSDGPRLFDCPKGCSCHD